MYRSNVIRQIRNDPTRTVLNFYNLSFSCFPQVYPIRGNSNQSKVVQCYKGVKWEKGLILLRAPIQAHAFLHYILNASLKSKISVTVSVDRSLREDCPNYGTYMLSYN